MLVFLHRPTLRLLHIAQSFGVCQRVQGGKIEICEVLHKKKHYL
jgi:hypothetical protein